MHPLHSSNIQAEGQPEVNGPSDTHILWQTDYDLTYMYHALLYTSHIPIKTKCYFMRITSVASVLYNLMAI